MENSAVEWLEQQIKDTFYVAEASEMAKRFEGIFEQAKEMEKQQHQETFKQSRLCKIFEKDLPPVWESWEQYYNEKFNKK